MISPMFSMYEMLEHIGITDGILINSAIILALLLLIAFIVEYVVRRKKGDKHD